MHASKRISIVALLSAALLGGCQNMPRLPSDLSGGDGTNMAITPMGDLPKPAARDWPDAQIDELNQRARGYGLARMPELKLYLDGLLAKIKKQAGVPDWPGGVFILATSSLEAYATAAGNIYISPSWISAAQSEDELVALLSHEFGHVYLHYHQLEGAIQDSNQAAQIAAVGVALAKKTGQATGWSAVDSLVMGYVAARDLGSAAWSRSQESAADGFGLNVSMKLGYSYDDGMKVFLERLSSWEAVNDERQQAKKAEMLQLVKEQSRNAILKPQDGSKTNFLSQPLADLNAGIAGLLHQGQESVLDGWSVSTAKHPQILARIDAMATAVEPLPSQKTSSPPVTASLQRAVREKNTAAAIRNYQLAAQAMENLNDPKALELAREATSGPTANHALPLMALFKAEAMAPPRPTVRGKPMDPAEVLDRNLKSVADRAWLLYVERGTQLYSRGQRDAAMAVMREGLTYFQEAGNAWPQAIKYVGQTKSWDDAKQLAKICNEKFKSMAEACTLAAASPAELAERERKSKEKAEQLVNKMMKKK